LAIPKMQYRLKLYHCEASILVWQSYYFLLFYFPLFVRGSEGVFSCPLFCTDGIRTPLYPLFIRGEIFLSPPLRKRGNFSILPLFIRGEIKIASSFSSTCNDSFAQNSRRFGNPPISDLINKSISIFT